MMAPASMVRPARPRMGSTTSAWNAFATPAPSKARRLHLSPSTPAVIEPPETLETRARRRRYPASLSRHSTPTWNTIAR